MMRPKTADIIIIIICPPKLHFSHDRFRSKRPARDLFGPVTRPSQLDLGAALVALEFGPAGLGPRLGPPGASAVEN